MSGRRGRAGRLALGMAAILMVAAAPAMAADAAQQTSSAPAADGRPVDAQVHEVAKDLRCPVCQGLSLADSQSELAREMKDVIRSQLEAGRTPDEVRAYFVSKYGEWILLEPRPAGFNLAVYLLPLLALIAGGLLIFSKVRQWTGTEAATTEAQPGAAPLEPGAG